MNVAIGRIPPVLKIKFKRSERLMFPDTMDNFGGNRSKKIYMYSC